MVQAPLKGIRIIEICGWFTAPMATCILADQGADVIKIEPPTGDVFRTSGTARNGFGAMFMSCNRNKRSVVLDLKKPDEFAALKALIATADVFVQNNKPGAMARLGLDAETLRAEFPRLIYCNVSAYGQTGPNAKEGGFDTMAQALTGLAVIQGGIGEQPRLVRTLVPDKITSPIVAQAITAALFGRLQTGEGATLDYNMLDGMLWWLWPDGMMNHSFLGDGVDVGADVGDVDLIARTEDGWLVAAPHMDGVWERFVEIVDRPELLEDPLLSTAILRGRNLTYFSARVRESFAGRTTAQWCSLLRAGDVPCAPVLGPGEVIDYPQTVWNGAIDETEHPVAGRYRAVRLPVTFDGMGHRTRTPVPAIGEHTEEVLREIGVTLDKYAKT